MKVRQAVRQQAYDLISSKEQHGSTFIKVRAAATKRLWMTVYKQVTVLGAEGT